MKFNTIIVSLFLSMVLFLSGCEEPGTGGSETGAGTVGEWSITVEVVGEEPFTFTNEDAELVGAVEIAAAEKDGDDLKDEHIWTGILLFDFLDYIGVEEFSVISIEASDGYTVELEPGRIDETGTGFGWMVDGEVLDEERGPLQFVNHNRGPKHWVKQVANVTIIH